MSGHGDDWDGERVRKWLERRLDAALNEQDRADRNGRGHEKDYDKAAAEEWVCRMTKTSEATGDQKNFEKVLKELLGQDEYRRTGVHDDRCFDREVRSYLRKVIRMTRANTGFENISRYQ